MARKTYNVGDLTNKVNNMLAASADDKADVRVALSVLLESVLMETGNYNGFAYAKSEYLPAAEQTDDNVLRPGYDGTRRSYFLL